MRNPALWIFILIPQVEHKIRGPGLARLSEGRSPGEARDGDPECVHRPTSGRGDFDGGLAAGVDTIGREVEAARSEMGGQIRQADARPVGPDGRPVGPINRRAGVPVRGGNGFGVGSLLGIGLMIVAVLVGIRLLGSLFGAGRGGYGAPGGSR